MSESLLGDSLRSQLRSRLDPIFNPAPPTDEVTTPLDNVPGSTPGSDTDRGRDRTTRGEGQLSEETADDDLLPHTQTPMEGIKNCRKIFISFLPFLHVYVIIE